MRSSRSFRSRGLASALVLTSVTAIAFSSNAIADTRCRTVGGDAENEVQRAVEQAPLYRALAAASPLVTCIVEQVTGRTSLAYRFSDSGSLRVERDAASEYMNQEAHVGRDFRERALEVLKRAEFDAFRPAGCGIDWRRASTERQLERPSVKVSVYRGDICNCQARIVRDERGYVETLALRSAC